MPSNPKHPGVYVVEQNAFPNSVVGLPTAVPAFIGYTPQANFRGKSYQFKPVKITSFSEFRAIFCFSSPPPPADPVPQYAPQYYLQELEASTNYLQSLRFAGKQYALLPDSSTIYYLYNSLRLFYQNGGREAFIVSVGTYGTPSGKSIDLDQPLVNDQVNLGDLLKGLKALKQEKEPTLYICPEATLLSLEDNATLMQAMLLQNEEMGTAMSIFDIIGARNPDPLLFMDDITTFRKNTGTRGLSYGAAYFPFLGTSITQPDELTYANLFGGDLSMLVEVLELNADDYPAVYTLLKEIRSPSKEPLTTIQYNQMLSTLSPDYRLIMERLRESVNLLPASGAIAGIYSMTDDSVGVWKSPANVSINGVMSLPFHINQQQQESLNIDPLTGKSINAIRSFPGRGVLVWGARTLAGNSSEDRYLAVRRTLIYLEQSCQGAIQAFVFEPNEQNTWITIKSMLENFLLNLWRAGGLAGTKPSDAFFINCGLGSTMTTQDIQEGRLIVLIGVAIVRPAEFIIIQLNLKMVAD